MATINTYSLRRDGDKNVSKNFKVREFRCKDGSDKILICKETVEILQAIRDYFGKPVTITSAYRTPSHNRKVGGASKSQHVKGTACDIKVQGVPSWAVAGFLEAHYRENGIGHYPTFCHIDSRGYRVLWKDPGDGQTVSAGTFGIGTSYQKYEYIEPVKPEPVERDDEVTQAEFDKMYDAMVRKLAEEDPSNWKDLDAAIKWAKQEGILKGDQNGRLMMQKPLTRQEMILMLYRAAKK